MQRLGAQVNIDLPWNPSRLEQPQRVERARPPMEMRYLRDVADDQGLDWEYTERVLSSRDLDEWMRQGW